MVAYTFRRIAEFNRVQRADTVGGFDASFTLLSEDMFVVSRFSESYEAGRAISGDTYGFLDVYQFNPREAAPPVTSRVASFALPLLDHHNLRTSVRIRCAPTSVVPTSRRNTASLPKMFELSPNNRLLCLEINLTPFHGVRPTKSAGTLYVPSSLLIDSIAKRQHMKFRRPDSIAVPWADWAERTSWVDTSNIGGSGCFVFGQRMAGLVQTPTGLGRRKVFMFDFDQRRLKSRGMLKEPAEGLVRIPGGITMKSARFEQIGEQVFCAGITRSSRKYVEATIILNEPSSSSDSVMIDDEHGKCIFS